MQKGQLIGDSTKLHFCKVSCKRKREKAPRQFSLFAGTWIFTEAITLPQELNVFQQEIEIRICKKTQFFSIAYYFISNWIAFIMLGGNLFFALIIVHICCNWRDNGCKILQRSWHDFMRIQFKKVFCWQSRTSEERKLKEIFFLISLSSAEDSKENVDYWDICNLVEAFDYKGSCADFCSEKNCFDVKGWGHHWEKGNVIKKVYKYVYK